MHPMLNTAVKAARRAGNIINRAAQNLDILQVQRKTRNDYVSEVDRNAEAAIIETLLGAYPQHAILGEESGAQGENAEYLWVIDPLDGTTNFLHGFPQYAVSIALLHRGVLDQAVIFDPTSNDLYTASKGRGAYLNDKRIRVNKRIKLQECIIGTGIPFRCFDHLDTYLAMLKSVILSTSGIRRPGSASLDLAHVAAGRYDGFWEIGLSKWDIAAGALLITEAGGLVGDFEGNESWFETGNIMAGNPKIFGQLLTVLAPHLTDALKTPR
jgi:myo-inositol-1(or 4)-monophosphatase